MTGFRPPLTVKNKYLIFTVKKTAMTSSKNLIWGVGGWVRFLCPPPYQIRFRQLQKKCFKKVKKMKERKNIFITGAASGIGL